MPATIKIYPPSQLPDKGVNETQFNIWTEELEVYLQQDDDFSVFLPGGKYSVWSSFETDPGRIPEVKVEDKAQRLGQRFFLFGDDNHDEFRRPNTLRAERRMKRTAKQICSHRE